MGKSLPGCIDHKIIGSKNGQFTEINELIKYLYKNILLDLLKMRAAI